MKKKRSLLSKPSKKGLKKELTGIRGLDKVLEGGIPKGRAILVMGSAGTGKTVMLNEFIYKGISESSLHSKNIQRT